MLLSFGVISRLYTKQEEFILFGAKVLYLDRYKFILGHNCFQNLVVLFLLKLKVLNLFSFWTLLPNGGDTNQFEKQCFELTERGVRIKTSCCTTF